MELVFCLDDIDKAAEKLIAVIGHHKVFAFHGNLGAGKTTFIQALCRKLEVEQNVSSPTFSIINEYTTDKDKIIYHIDLYRLKDEEEAIRVGVEECLFSGCICFVEWPERALEIFPDQTVHLYFDIRDGEKRKILYELV